MKIVVALLGLIALVGCEATNEHYRKVAREDDANCLEEHLSCRWNQQYSTCFCYSGCGYSNIVIYVPDKTCGK